MGVSVKILIMSHLSDCAIDKKNYHLEFSKYLLIKYPNTSVEINADEIWTEFVESCEKRKYVLDL
jgi:hypothetical protein